MSDTEQRLQQLEKEVAKISRQLDRMEVLLTDGVPTSSAKAESELPEPTPPAPLTMAIVSTLMFFGLLSLLVFILELAGIISDDGHLYRYAFTGGVLIAALIVTREVFAMGESEDYLYSGSLRFSLIISLALTIPGAAWLVYDSLVLHVEGLEGLHAPVLLGAGGLVALLSLVVWHHRK